ncbi:unnamed protein product, partial [Polarella glacialis]
MDDVVSTSLRILHKPSEDRPAWVGIDYLSEANWVRCVRIKQGSLSVEQVPSLEVKIWDGQYWKDGDPDMKVMETKFEGLGGGGWQRRPAKDGSMWRLQNGVFVEEGWALYETELFQLADCSPGSKVFGEAIASGFVPPEYENGPDKAFDGDTVSAWNSQCSEVPELRRPKGFGLVKLPVGCNKSAAWIGLDLGATVTADIRCVRVYQVGYRRMQSPIIDVAKWDGAFWVRNWTLDGLGGSAWDQRPAASNALWRMLWVNRKEKTCRNQRARSEPRSWGVANLAFYSDDNCDDIIDGGIPVSSGSIESFQTGAFDQLHYDANLTVDASKTSTWAANCLSGWRSWEPQQARNNSHPREPDCKGEWLGLDFQRKAVEVRCVKIVQSRLESGKCCDPADELELQRWNGVGWVEATWIKGGTRVPGFTPTSASKEQQHIGAVFKLLGRCPYVESASDYSSALVEEKRGRRDSDKCVIQLTGATTLLGEPFCIKHPRCVMAFGAVGSCCPVGSLKESMNRCCCNFLNGERIFEDEPLPAPIRDKFNFEYAAVWIAGVLPFVGLAATVICYTFALATPADITPRVSQWVMAPLDSYDRFPHTNRFLRRCIAILLWPLLVWRTFLGYSKTTSAEFFNSLIRPNGNLPGPRHIPRALAFLFIGFAVSGMAPWIVLGVILGEILLRGVLALSLVIKIFASPFNPLDLRDMALRRKLTNVRVKKADDTAQALDIASGGVFTLVASLVYFLKFIFDMLIMRAQMLSLSVIESIDADRVVDIFPGVLSLLKEPGMLMYRMMSWSGQTLSWALGTTMGIPLCEGSCVVVGSVALIMILWGGAQWLNYDLFGLFTASRQMVKATRPECQRAFAQAWIMACLSISFGIVQMMMVLFTRALYFANPFKESQWMCPYDDSLAVYIGRGMLSISALVGLSFVFLCVNGHFFGQDYITERVGNYLNINLATLDPDGASKDGGGWFRTSVFGAALPTLMGVWLDRWNITAFLVQPRAKVY